MIRIMTRNRHLGDFNFSLEQFQQLLHSVIGRNGYYYHSHGGSKFPIHALPFDMECEWANPFTAILRRVVELRQATKKG